MTYSDRTVLHNRVGQRGHFATNEYVIKAHYTLGKKYSMIKLTALNVIDQNQPNVLLQHVNIDLKVPNKYLLQIQEHLNNSGELRFTALINRYKHRNMADLKNDLFDKLDAINQGKPVGEVQPKFSYGLVSAEIKIPECWK